MDNFINLECFTDFKNDYEGNPVFYKRDLKKCSINIEHISYIIYEGECQIFSKDYCLEKEEDIYGISLHGIRSLFITSTEYAKLSYYLNFKKDEL